MKTSTKIVALLATQSNAFFTELFSSETVEAKPATSFSESLYSAQDFVYYNWYDGYYVPFDYDGSYDGDFEGLYGGDVNGYIDYTIDGAYWYLDGVYALGLYATYVSAFEGGLYGLYYGAYGYGLGALGAVYVPSYYYWYIASYGGSSGYLYGYYDGFWGQYYAILAAYQEGAIYYQYYNGAGWLGAGNYGAALYGQGDYDGLFWLYYYGYYNLQQVMIGIYSDYYYGDLYVYSNPQDYSGYFSYWYYDTEFYGPYYFYSGFYSFTYGEWDCYSYFGVSGVYVYGAGDDYTAAFGYYSYWYGFIIDSDYFGFFAKMQYSADYYWGGYYDGYDYTGFSLYMNESAGSMEYNDATLYGGDWYVTVGYASTDIEVSYWVEYFATELMMYYYSMY